MAGTKHSEAAAIRFCARAAEDKGFQVVNLQMSFSPLHLPVI